MLSDLFVFSPQTVDRSVEGLALDWKVVPTFREK